MLDKSHYVYSVVFIQRPISKWNNQDQWNSPGQNVGDVGIESYQIPIDNKGILFQVHFHVFSTNSIS